MKKLLGILALVALSACQQNKIGFVDYAELMNQYEAKKTLESKFQGRAQALAQRRDSISQAFQFEAQNLQTKSRTMSQTQAQEEYNALQQRGQLIGGQLQQEEQRIQQQGQQQMDTLILKVKERIGAYGKANGYQYILAGGEGGTVLYGDSAEDLTDVILKLLNDEYKP